MQLVNLAEIEFGNNRRKISEETVCALMDSISKIGLHTPPTVCLKEDGKPFLVTGRHRVEALLRLGKQEAECTVIPNDPILNRMLEISENYHRGELTVLERSEYVAEWIKLDKVRLKPTKPASKGMLSRKKTEIDDVAQSLGIEKSQATNSMKIDTISPEAKAALKAAGEDNNQTVLVQIASVPVNSQIELVNDLIAAKKEKKAAKKEKRDTQSVRDEEVKQAAEEFSEWFLNPKWHKGTDDIPMLETWFEIMKPSEMIAILKNKRDAIKNRMR